MNRAKVKVQLWQLAKACGAKVPSWYLDKMCDEFLQLPTSETAPLMNADFQDPRTRGAVRAWFRRMEQRHTPGWKR